MYRFLKTFVFPFNFYVLISPTVKGLQIKFITFKTFIFPFDCYNCQLYHIYIFTLKTFIFPFKQSMFLNHVLQIETACGGRQIFAGFQSHCIWYCQDNKKS